jgi:hypothetical protein
LIFLGILSLYAVKRNDSMVEEVAKASGMISMMDLLMSSSLCMVNACAGWQRIKRGTS